MVGASYNSEEKQFPDSTPVNRVESDHNSNNLMNKKEKYTMNPTSSNTQPQSHTLTLSERLQLNPDLATTVTVRTFGVHYKWLRHLPDNIFTQLKLAHDLRETLVETWYDYLKAVDAVWMGYPAIAAAQQALDDAQLDKARANAVIKALRTTQRTKKITGPDADQAKADLANANAALKTAKAALKLARDSEPTAVDGLKQAGLDRVMRENEIVREYATERGLFYDTAHLVHQQHKTAVKRVQDARKQAGSAAHKSTDPHKRTSLPNLHHHRFDGTGTIAVYLKGRSGRNTRSPEEVANLNGPHRNTFCLPAPRHEDWDDMSTAQRRHNGRITARMRVTTGDVKTNPDAVTKIPLQAHRLLPEQSVVKLATLTVSRIGTRRIAQVNVTCVVPASEEVIPASTCYAHFGWRKDTLPDGTHGYRAMTWRATKPLYDLDVLRADPRYTDLARCMVMDEDGCGGHIVLPESWMTKHRDAELMRSERDERTNEVRTALIDWLKLVGPVQHPSRIDPDTGNPETITTGRVAQWKNPVRFVRLALDWRDNPPALPGGTDIADVLESWRAQDKRINDAQNGASVHAARRRDDLYRQVVSWLVDSYDEFVLETVNHNQLAVLAGADENVPNEVAQRLRRQRSLTAAATMRNAIIGAAAREGCIITQVPACYVSVDHLACGTRNVRIDGAMRIVCQGCGEVYDVDDNAVAHIEQRV